MGLAPDGRLIASMKEGAETWQMMVTRYTSWIYPIQRILASSMDGQISLDMHNQ